MNESPFWRRLRSLALVVWFQRALRLSLRAGWLAAGGYLLAWSAHARWGWMPDPRHRLAAGAAMGLLPALGIFFPWPSLGRLAWRLDRTYGFKEQISAAWQVSRRGARGVLEPLLLEEAAELVEDATRTVLRRGWFLARDFVSALIVFALYAVVFGQSWTVSPLAVPPAQVAQLPPMGEDPSADQIFPSGILGLEATPTPTPTPAPGDIPGAGGRQGTGGGMPSPTGSMMDALQQLGQSLGQEAASHEAGQALQQGDMEGAAEALEVLGDQVGQLSGLTTTKLSLAFGGAADQMGDGGEGGEEELQEDLENAAEALRADDETLAQESLDRVAADLRELGAQMAANEGEEGGAGDAQAGDRERGDAEPVSRLLSEGETVELGESGSAPGVLSPGEGAGPEAAPADAGYDQAFGGDSQAFSNTLNPYYFSWRWRDVVSQYFSPH